MKRLTETGFAVIVTRDDGSEYFMFLDNCSTVTKRRKTAARSGKKAFAMLKSRDASWARIPKRYRVVRAKIVELPKGARHSRRL